MFLNDAVLRAFELLATERQVTRPNIAVLMGAFGAAPDRPHALSG